MCPMSAIVCVCVWVWYVHMCMDAWGESQEFTSVTVLVIHSSIHLLRQQLLDQDLTDNWWIQLAGKSTLETHLSVLSQS